MHKPLASLLAVLALGVTSVASAQEVTPQAEPPQVVFEIEQAEVSQEDLDTLRLMLSGFHGLPESTEFEAHFDDPTAVLFAFVLDPEIPSLFRDRAIAALSFWPSEDVQRYYEHLLAASTTSSMNRYRVIELMGHAFGDAALPTIEPYLTSEDVQLRLSAVHALSQVDSPSAQALLTRALELENDVVVIEQIRAVQSLE